MLNKKKLFIQGLKDGIPIGIGYIPTTIAISMLAVKMAIPLGPWGLMSALLYSGSAQLAILNIIADGSTDLLKYIITFFIINCKCILLSLSLARKTDENMGILKRSLFIIFNTDEIFATAMQKEGTLKAPYLFGIASIPFSCQMIGIFSGYVFSRFLPQSIKSAFGITIYSMLLALIIPPMKKSNSVFFIVSISAMLSTLMECLPFFHLEAGTVLIVCTIVSCLIGAVFFPIEENYKIEDSSINKNNI